MDNSYIIYMTLELLREQSGPLPNSVRVGFAVILVAFLINMTIPQAAKAESIVVSTGTGSSVEIKSAKPLDLLSKKFIAYENSQKHLKYRDPLRVATVIATAYSSTVDQTDSTPCITASGFNVCKHGKEDILAANFLPLGAKVRIPELYGTRIFTVEDRMNKRYDYRVDLWKKDRNTAITFGKRLIKIEVVQY